MITLQNLSKCYTTKSDIFYALSDIDLSLSAGEIFGVIGKSGAGKSTLLRCVNFLEIPTNGSVLIDGTDLSTLNKSQLRSLRHKIGMIFQHFNLLESRDAFDNIALPLELIGTPQELIQRKVSDLLELVGLKDRQHHYPSELSGGQKQRVAIARALATDPSILLCDEATSALDPESTKNILRLLSDINKKLNITILLITHELDVIKTICDRAGVLDQGRLIEVATTLDLFANPQHTTTKQLIEKAFHFDSSNVDAIKANTQQHERCELIRLTFLGNNSDTSYITQLVRQYDVTVNIQQADIFKIKEKSIGYTICEIMGSRDKVEQALAYIQSSPIKLEALHHA